jgi:general stress protein YciG
LDNCDFFDGWSELYDIYDKFSSEPGKKGADSTNREKDELGRSINAVKGATKTLELGIGIFGMTPEEKTAAGRKGAARSMELRVGLTARNPEKMSEDGKKGGKASGAQRWHSTIDGFESNAAGVTRHNKANGWDPGARVKVI